MRRINGIIAMAVLLLFVIHGVMGALNLMDIAPLISKALSYTMLALIGVHAVIGVYLTVKPIAAAKKTGAPYVKENRLFWARRLSGFLILILVAFHLTAFNTENGGIFRLVPFDIYRLITQILFLLSIAVHVITNVKPMLITLGIRKLKLRAGDILFFITCAMIFMALGFIIYYIRWVS